MKTGGWKDGINEAGGEICRFVPGSERCERDSKVFRQEGTSLCLEGGGIICFTLTVFAVEECGGTARSPPTAWRKRGVMEEHCSACS